MASETAQPDELLQVVTELEELRQRNLQLLVHKASAQVQERALQVELKNIRVVRDACLAQGEKAASDISKAHESAAERERVYMSAISKMVVEAAASTALKKRYK